MIITVTELAKRFRGQALYERVNLEIRPGIIHALVGPNGSGKSVLLRLLCGLLKPDSGDVVIDPQFLDRRRVFPDRFGVLIDRPGALPHLSGIANLTALARIRHRTGNAELAALMRSFGLDPENLRRVRHYSLGMKQKLALCQAFMEDPRVLILDEPFNALDEISAQNLRERLRGLAADGVTIVFTSHDPRDVELLAQRIFVIEHARVVERSPVP
ncbi:ABC-2 type transport system ATP-binding protein [Mycetocola sp. BIGb0189]|uniref:ATP-binding cassette domain-containing protein n=1 Tax=Mycetocola sp. BIGb0189 TaxID=2940604 RepID=UPI0021680E46|nr:ABC transporter ATP-binding protein [Mycetocola sp. BIGb0189]MCS4275889.1 ABC-2 type transport system ATP-binding protein [Mycetocola sp. BIGb0189]